MSFKAAVITSSDKGSAGLREDKSGPLIGQILTENGYEVVYTSILPDDRKLLSEAMAELCDNGGIHLLLTTGGTGFSPRDVTPEATLDICERMVPGIPEAMRLNSLQINKKAMLSRAAAGIRKNTLIINLPGSPKAVRENLEYIIPALGHGLEILCGLSGECASAD